MSNYTPGPWGIVKDKRNINYGDIESCYNGALVCIMPEIDSGLEDELISEADARLIATAPEMKDLLWDAWQDLNALSNGDQSCDARYEATETMEKIMSLLHRIDGEEETE